MTKQEVMAIVYNHLAIDYNCKSDDFTKDCIIFTIAENTDGNEICHWDEFGWHLTHFKQSQVISRRKLKRL